MNTEAGHAGHQAGHQIDTKVRQSLKYCLEVLFTLYVVALTCSMSGMEILSWSAAFFFLLYTLVSRSHRPKGTLFYRIGVELPLVILVITVAFGMRLNAPDRDFVFAMGSLRNLGLLFFVAYILQIYRNLNRLFFILAAAASVVAVYGIWQHFSGIDIWRHDHRALMQIPWGNKEVYATVGFFNHHLTYAHSYAMILCIPWAALLLKSDRPAWQKSAFVLSFGLILTSILYTYGRGVWIAILVTLPIMAFVASKRVFFATLLLLALLGGALLKFDRSFQERAMTVFAENYKSNEDRKKLWEANIAMFHEHPWIGVGYRQNEPLSMDYYDKLGIKDGMAGHAHNNYLQMLSTTGIIGFVCYMVFILAFLLMTVQLWNAIPPTHYWHRVFALAALGAQIAFHIGGLTQWNFGDTKVQHQFIFWLAVVSYMRERYISDVVPNDTSL